MDFSYNGLHQTVASFGGSAELGDLVTISGNGEVTKAASGKDIAGICVSKRGEVLGIQLTGTAEVSFTGTAPALGYSGLNAAGNNQIKSAADGRKLLVLWVDAANSKAVILL